MSLFPRALAPIFIAMVCVIVPTGRWLRPPPEAPPSRRSRRRRRCWSPGAWTGPEVPGDEAVLLEDGTAAAPANAPEQVKQAIWAANSLQELPYRYGGGHNLKFDVADGADCSGTVSFALKAAGLLDAPLDSGSFMKWGEKRQGRLDHRLHEPGPRLRRRSPGLRLDTSVGPAPTRCAPRTSPRARSSAARAGAPEASGRRAS